MHIFRRRERVFRARGDPYELYDDTELLRRYWFDSRGLRHLERTFTANMRRPTRRNRPLLPIEQLCLTLRFYTAGPHQLVSKGVSLVLCGYINSTDLDLSNVNKLTKLVLHTAMLMIWLETRRKLKTYECVATYRIYKAPKWYGNDGESTSHHSVDLRRTLLQRG